MKKFFLNLIYKIYKDIQQMEAEKRRSYARQHYLKTRLTK